MIESIAKWGDGADLFEVVGSPVEGAAELRSRADPSTTIRVTRDPGDPRVILAHDVALSAEARRLAQGDPANHRFVLDLVTQANAASSGLAGVTLAGDDGPIRVRCVIYEDGFSRHSLNQAVAETVHVSELIRDGLTRFVDSAAELAEMREVVESTRRRLEEGKREAQRQTARAAEPVATAPPADPQPAAWAATHRAPGAMQWWPAPDPALPAAGVIQPGTELAVVERRGDWARVTASNGWQGWVDGRLIP